MKKDFDKNKKQLVESLERVEALEKEAVELNQDYDQLKDLPELVVELERSNSELVVSKQALEMEISTLKNELHNLELGLQGEKLCSEERQRTIDGLRQVLEEKTTLLIQKDREIEAQVHRTAEIKVMHRGIILLAERCVGLCVYVHM